MGTLKGGQKMSAIFPGPKNHVYFIAINGTFNGAPTPIIYPGLLLTN
jgi:hypothetical protein